MNKKFTKSMGRRAACIGLTAVMGASFLAGQLLSINGGSVAAAENNHSIDYENVTGKADLTEVKLSNLNPAVLEMLNSEYSADSVHTAIVVLSEKSLSEGGDSADIENEQAAFCKKLASAGIGYDVRSVYSNIVNAVAVDVKVSSLAAIKSMSGVVTVTLGEKYARPKEETASSSGGVINYSSIYQNGIYNSSEYLDKADGTGMSVAILDTGIDYTHDAFLEAHLNDIGAVKFKASDVEEAMAETEFKATKRTGATASDVYVNAKIPFAYDYADDDADVYPSYSQHGTHVAGIVGGKSGTNADGSEIGYTDKNGQTATDEEGNVLPFRGVAPEAQLVICKVFTDDFDDVAIGGADTINILDALEDCTSLGVDVINMSLGTSGGFSSASLTNGADDEGKLMDMVYGNIRAKGISLIVAASNDYSAGYGSAYGTNLATNPDSGTVGSPSTYLGALSVASVNGQTAPFLMASGFDADPAASGSAIYYNESRNEDSDAYNFVEDILGVQGATGAKDKAVYKYVVVPGTGEPGDYTATTNNELKNKEGTDGIIAVVRRGGSTFKDKVETAYKKGADAVIVYNNVSGMVSMSLGDLRTHVPAISVSMDAGLVLTGSGATRKSKGKIAIDRSYLAGPFMNDYSSWGTTPDLKLKPDVTSHGGEITSTVAGGYAEMSGTSMASPNLAGFTAILRSYLSGELQSLWQTASASDPDKTTKDNVNLTYLTNNLTMSTATTVYDQNNLPYSPRKQGAGLATLKNAFTTNAYLYTKEADGYRTDYPTMSKYEDGRPKAELGADKDKNGVYDMTFYVKNFGSESLEFTLNSIFMTETLGLDGKSVAEKAHVFGSKASWKIDNQTKNEGDTITVAANSESKIEVTLKLTAAEKRYIDQSFANGMFIEGFIQLVSPTASADDGQCSLNFPFVGFYGDWNKSPMLDYNCYEIAAFEKDTSLKEEERPQARVWATQAYSYYWNQKYATPLGSFMYLQDETKEHTSEYIYTTEEYTAISRFNDVNYENESASYYSITGIRALYAGLLRNAEIVTYTLKNVDTGEIIPDEYGNLVREKYRISKAYAGGGSAMPGMVVMEMNTDELGLAANGKYELSFDFYFDYDDYANGEGTDDNFTMTFYVDYEAPVLTDARIRYQDKKDENGKITQQVYLDLDVFDNHYPQAVILCYSLDDDPTDVKLATRYITPVLNPKKNGTTTVTIDVTDFYDDYNGALFVEIDDYAMNHNVYKIEYDYVHTAVCSGEFSIQEGEAVTVEKNSSLQLNVAGSGNNSNYVWTSNRPDRVIVKNGEIFGVKAGDATVTVSNGKTTQTVKVTVVESENTIKLNSLSFTTMVNIDDVPVKASGTVRVAPAQQINLKVAADPWYYPVDRLEFVWESSDPSVATVDQNGHVSVLFEQDEKTRSVNITATARDITTGSAYTAVVALSVQEPYSVSNMTLTKYRGWGGELVDEVTVGSQTYRNVRVLTIPNDKSITTIGEDCFKDNANVEIVVIPKNVQNISQSAFENCANLKAVCFIDTQPLAVASSSLATIYRQAFLNCPSLEVVDLSNCKVITLDRNVFTDCVGLKEVVKATAIGTMGAESFAGCTSLEKIDVSKLHVAHGSYFERGLFEGCTALSEVITSPETAMSPRMFYGCTALERLSGEDGNEGFYAPNVANYAFYNCYRLQTVALKSDVSIGAYAFANCTNLASLECDGIKIASIGDYAFRACTALRLEYDLSETELGYKVFDGAVSFGEALYSEDGTTLLIAPQSITSSFSLRAGVTKIGANAFSHSTMSGATSINLTGVTEIGAGAFRNLVGLTSVTNFGNLKVIENYAFSGTGLTSFTVPASVEKIGYGAFMNCASLSELTFASGSALKEIGAYAFSGIAIRTLELPDGVETIGDAAFAWCANLTSAEISSVKTMGEGVFMACPKLERATFGADATTTGNFTFWAFDYTVGEQGVRLPSALTSVSISENTEVIGAGAFAYCSSLRTIDLKNAKRIGAEAFFGCTSLTTVTGLEAVDGGDQSDLNSTAPTLDPRPLEEPSIGNNAFNGCTSLASVDLTAAKQVAYEAFFGCSSLTSVTFGDDLTGLGENVFAGTALATVTIPAGCTYVGEGAFGDNTRLYSIEVEEGNKNYFSEDGVLYRNIRGVEGSYELVIYPLGKIASTDETPTYTIKVGTVTIEAFAFYNVPAKSVGKVILPYTLKTIGDGAFLGSGITVYQFESIVAPTLLEGISVNIITDPMDSSNYSLFYNNFVSFFAYCAPHKPGGELGGYLPNDVKGASTLTILYPTNGTGYDNFVYTYYFGTKTLLGELPEDDTRTLLALIEGFEDADTVAGWATSKEPTKAEVQAFSDSVKTAHQIYNRLKSETQLNYVGQQNIEKLFAIEAALKPVKAAYGITVRVTRVSVDESSAHRSEYVVGETFSLAGLKLRVVYDDYSESVIDAVGNFELNIDYDKALLSSDSLVMIDGVGDYYGTFCYIDIVVGEKIGGGAEVPVVAIVVPVVAVVVLAAAAVAVVLILKKKKGAATVADASVEEDENAAADAEVENGAGEAGETAIAETSDQTASSESEDGANISVDDNPDKSEDVNGENSDNHTDGENNSDE